MKNLGISFSFIFVVIISFISLISCENLSVSDDISDEEIINSNLQIVGKIFKTHEGKNYYAFRGIPYAKPPIVERRFKDPEPYGKWDGLLDAKQDGNICPQAINDSKTFTMSEDCLILNIYTKSMEDSKPVIVYIHGGAYKYGSGNSLDYGPKYLLDEDVVLVTFNYRLGPFGFVSSGTKDATGNFAFKDQVLALKWVRDNILNFGGNPNSVTLMGHSAGALAVTLHMASPMSENLFHKVIALSASATHHWKAQNLFWTRNLADLVNCSSNSSEEMIECLREKPWQEIIKACSIWGDDGLSRLEWNVEVENDFGQEKFISKDPSVLFKSGDFAKIPVFVGITKDEFMDQGHKVILNTSLLNEFSENFDQLAPKAFGYNTSELSESKKITSQLKELYFKDREIGISTETELSNLFSDALINHGVHRFVQLSSQYIDVYFFRFDFKGRYTCSFYNSHGEPFYVYHEDVLLYLFTYPRCGAKLKDKDPEFAILKKFTKYIMNFIEFADPNGFDIKKKGEHTWKPSTKEAIKTFYINEISEMDGPPFQGRLKVWDKLFPVE